MAGINGLVEFLAPLQDPEDQLIAFLAVLAHQCLDVFYGRGFQRLETEALVKSYHESLKPSPSKTPKGTSFSIPEEQKKAFVAFFGAKIDVKVAGNGKGKITIPFHSEEDFNRILKLIKG